MRDAAFVGDMEGITNIVMLLNLQVRDIRLREMAALGAMVSKGHLGKWDEYDQTQKIAHQCRAQIKDWFEAWNRFCVSI